MHIERYLNFIQNQGGQFKSSFKSHKMEIIVFKKEFNLDLDLYFCYFPEVKLKFINWQPLKHAFLQLNMNLHSISSYRRTPAHTYLIKYSVAYIWADSLLPSVNKWTN